MGYIVDFDYTRLIQDTTLQQIISSNPKLKGWAESAALEEIKSYLRAKYEVDAEFTETQKYSHTAATYKAGDRVYLDAPLYNDKKTYVLNELTLKSGEVYFCNNAITVAEEWTVGKWTKLGAQYDIFYAKYPKDKFDIEGVYAKGDQVFWKGKTYTCVIPTQALSHDSKIQYQSTTQYPLGNVYPDDTENGVKYWGAGVTYSIAAGQLLVTTIFAPGDNRNQQLVNYVLDVIIYHLYRRIPPAVVPEIRVLSYQAAISWLIKVSKGEEVVPNITKKQPKNTGSRIRYGSRPKQENYY